MATISNTPRPGYVWDATDNVWYPIGVGGHSHSEIAKTIADAKGDLIVGTAADTVDRLAVGNNGETLVADSSTATGLRYTGLFGANKNKIINGDFGIWQRGTSFTIASNVTTFTADRFYVLSTHSSGTTTASQQTFTPGTAPVAGYEGQYFHRITNSAATTNTEFQQRIEDVRTFAGQTVTISFWAKASSTVTMGNTIVQNFGSGGSGNVGTTGANQTFTTSWARYSITINVPSISGKTVGTSSHLQVYPFYYSSGTIASNVIDIWGVQVEAGSVATAFQTATGTLQGELAACQRYYYRFAATSTNQYFGAAYARSTTNAFAIVKQPVTMRSAPSLAFASGSTYFRFQLGGGDFDVTTLDGTYYATTDTALVRMTSSGMTAGNGGMAQFNNASAFIEMSSEL
jgi:hypothetical protein